MHKGIFFVLTTLLVLNIVYAMGEVPRSDSKDLTPPSQQTTSHINSETSTPARSVMDEIAAEAEPVMSSEEPAFEDTTSTSIDGVSPITPEENKTDTITPRQDIPTETTVAIEADIVPAVDSSTPSSETDVATQDSPVTETVPAEE